MSVKSSISLIQSRHIVSKYIDDVLSGKIAACKYTKLAIERHLSDLKTAKSRGFYFDEAAAVHVIDFVHLLKHSKGKWAGKSFELSPWQYFITWVLFGWKNKNGTRRFRTFYLELARKNGKSTFVAALGLYCLAFDGEGGAEVYSIATKEDQAKITFNEGSNMTKKSGNLGGLATVHKKAISVESTNSFWKPLGRDSDTQDGFNPHMVIVDEFHAHKDRSLLDVMDSALGARTQPLVFIITTAGFNVQSACYIERDYVIKVLKSEIEDDTYFGIIYSLDRDESSGEMLDDWDNPEVWIKANPNLGISVFEEDMKRLCQKAKGSPTTKNNFLVKKLNIWTTQENKFFNMEKWQACNDTIDESELLGKPCYVGVDLASRRDIAAISCIFHIRDKVVVVPQFFCPREAAQKRSREDRVPYLLWEQQGYLTLTDGAVTDYDIIKQELQKIWQQYDVVEMGYDGWNFDYLYQRLLTDGVDAERLCKYEQTMRNMSAPTKELDALVVSGRLIHNNNPILGWMAANTAVYTDVNENVRPVKDKSREKIDGIVATIIALGMAMTKNDTIDKEANLMEVGI